MRTTLHRSANRTRSLHRVCFFVVAYFAGGFCQGTNAQTPATATASQADTDAAAKAAERKKRFEEAKKALENKIPPAPEPKTPIAPSSPKAIAKPVTLATANNVFSIQVTMGVGESQRFYLFDEQLGDVTGISEWTVKDDSSAADFSIVGGVPTVVSNGSGTVLVSAVFRGRSAFMILTIIPRDKMTGETVRWNQAVVQAPASLHIVPAVPSFGPHR
jgi:hypothetical protein